MMKINKKKTQIELRNFILKESVIKEFIIYMIKQKNNIFKFKIKKIKFQNFKIKILKFKIKINSFKTN